MGIQTFSPEQDFSDWGVSRLEKYNKDLAVKGDRRDRQVRKNVERILRLKITNMANISYRKLTQNEVGSISLIDFLRDNISDLKKYGVDTKKYEDAIKFFGPNYTKQEVIFRLKYLSENKIDVNKQPTDDLGQYAPVSNVCDAIKEAKEFLTKEEICDFIKQMEAICKKLEDEFDILIVR